jgi:hypothetical protein
LPFLQRHIVHFFYTLFLYAGRIVHISQPIATILFCPIR